MNDAISQLEKEIQEKKQELAKLRREAPQLAVDDDVFSDAHNESVNLSDLFGDKQELILIYNVGGKCPYCTLWADGFNGMRHHLEDRAAFVVSSPDSPSQQQAFAKSRGWTFKMVSSSQKFRQKMGFETEDNRYLPGVSVFVKGVDGGIKQASKAIFGPGDNYCSTWDLFDLLPSGSEGWGPKLNY